MRRWWLSVGLALGIVAGLSLLVGVPVRSAPPWPQPVVSPPVKPVDTRGLPPAPSPASLITSSVPSVRPLRPLPHRSAAFDESVVSSLLPARSAAMPALLMNFEGVSNTGVYPPDTTGQVGAAHYVQMVNAAVGGAQVRVWDKTTGSQLYNFALADLWPTTDPCYKYAYGDPIVLYDHLADRWLLTQFVWPPAPPYYECVAVSKTGTPTNNPSDWYLYTFQVHSSKFNDYPKFGLWPDAYYMSANQFVIANGSESWAGAGVWAFDRAAMLAGQPASFVYFDVADLNQNYGGLLPATLLGDNLPPAGAPDYFLAVDQDWNGASDVLHVFEFHVDWSAPALSTFRLVKDLVVAPFDWYLGPGKTNIPQPNGAPALDELTDRLMMPLVYRNFGDHESLVVNHTVDAAAAPNTTLGQAGIRWYEVRGGAVDTTFADASIYQQGTFAPGDGLHRWMGSIAMDYVGNIALGYSVSGSSVYPGIRYAGRLVNDPLGTMAQGEAVIVNGSGVQTGALGRWGDYSAMSVDPVDDCTFWYTQEYIQASGDLNWQTRIASFKFPNCQRTPGFTLSVEPAEQAICVSQTTQYTVTVGQVNQFTQPVSLAIENALPGATIFLTPTVVVPPGSSRLWVSSTQSLLYGRYPITVTAQSNGQLPRGATVNLWVFTQPPAAPVLASPASGSLSQPTRPTFSWKPTDQANSYTLQIADTPTFTRTVVEVRNLHTTTYTLTKPLTEGQTYYWRIQADNACGQMASPIWWFYVPAPGVCPPGQDYVSLFVEDFTSGAAGWTHGGINDTWTLTETQRSGPGFHADELSVVSDQWLASPPITLPLGMTSLWLQFWNQQSLEASGAGCYDGALLEVSVDGGQTWDAVPDRALLTDPYDGLVDSRFNNPLGGRLAWCGDPQDWLASLVDVSAYAGEVVRFRFRLGTDDSVARSGGGWWIDEVQIQGCTYRVFAPLFQH